jgi:hypothetical protein
VKLLPRIRISTLLLLMLVLALFFALYVQKRQEAQLLASLSLYRDPRTEAILDALDQRFPLTYADEIPLEDILKETKRLSNGRPKLASGIPIYVDPIGLQEVEKSMTSTVKRPPLADKLSLGEHLRIALDPLGLAYVVKDGCLMITSKESLDKEMGDAIDPYRMYRDVLQ